MRTRRLILMLILLFIHTYAYIFHIHASILHLSGRLFEQNVVVHFHLYVCLCTYLYIYLYLYFFHANLPTSILHLVGSYFSQRVELFRQVVDRAGGSSSLLGANHSRLLWKVLPSPAHIKMKRICVNGACWSKYACALT